MTILWVARARTEGHTWCTCDVFKVEPNWVDRDRYTHKFGTSTCRPGIRLPHTCREPVRVMFKRGSSKKSMAAAGAPATGSPPLPGSATPSPPPQLMGGGEDGVALRAAREDAVAARAESGELRSRVERMGEENAALKGQVHLLKFKVDLLVDMVTLANLDCDKLEDELEAATGAEPGS